MGKQCRFAEQLLLKLAIPGLAKHRERQEWQRKERQNRLDQMIKAIQGQEYLLLKNSPYSKAVLHAIAQFQKKADC